MIALYTPIIQEKVTYAAAAATLSFLQFDSIQLVTPACGWLPLIGGQYVFALRVPCGAKTSSFDCFCRQFSRVCKRPCLTTIMLLDCVTWIIASFFCHIPSVFRKVIEPS